MTISEFFKTAPKGASFDITTTLSLDEPVTAYAVSLGNGGYLDFSDEGGITGVEKRQGGFEDFLRYLEETGTIGDYGYIETPTGNERIQGYRNPEETKKLIEECFLGDEEDYEDEDYEDEDYEESEPEDYVRQAYDALNKHLPEVLTEKVKSYFSSWNHTDKIKDAERKITPEMIKKINEVIEPFGDEIFSSEYNPDDAFLLLADNAYPAEISSLSKKDFYKDYQAYDGGSDGDRLSIKNVLGVDNFSEFDKMDPREILDKYQEVQEDWYEFWGINDLPSIRKEIIACELDENYEQEGLEKKILAILDGKDESEPTQTFDVQCELWDVEASRLPIPKTPLEKLKLLSRTGSEYKPEDEFISWGDEHFISFSRKDILENDWLDGVVNERGDWGNTEKVEEFLRKASQKEICEAMGKAFDNNVPAYYVNTQQGLRDLWEEVKEEKRDVVTDGLEENDEGLWCWYDEPPYFKTFEEGEEWFNEFFDD